MQREDRAFQQGKDAAARLVRALSVPNRVVQLSVARALVDAAKQTESLITAEVSAAYDAVRWEPGSLQAEMLPNLLKWYSGPDAIDADPVEDVPAPIPA